MKYWNIPNTYRGKTALLLGGGQSLPDLVKEISPDRVRDNGNIVIAINDSFRLCPWAHLLFFGDAKWYWWSKEDVDKFSGLKVTCNRMPPTAKYYNRTIRKVDVPDINVVQELSGKGICVKENAIYFNSSSGAAAINLAYQMGIRTVVLIGYDMRVINGERNWKRHPDASVGIPKNFANFIKRFPRIAQDAKRLGLKIYNATPGSLLTMFPFVDIGDVCRS